MCFSILPEPRCRIPVLGTSWLESFHCLSRAAGNSFRFRVLRSINEVEGRGRRWTGKTEGRNKNTRNSKARNLLSQEISGGSITTTTNINVSKIKISESHRIQCRGTRQKIGESRYLVGRTTTVITFDMETTGLNRKDDRVIEIALRDLIGGKNSIFQTLVNPERSVPNQHIHHISTDMVSKPDIPRMKDLIPILLQYIKNRQKPGGQVLLVAHNARKFDVRFLINEFSRCNSEVPPDWRFLDTVPLSREAMESRGQKIPSKFSLQALREYYGIPLIGTPHRAMSDVDTLSYILERLTHDLKMTVPDLVLRSFTASDVINAKKKKKKENSAWFESMLNSG